MECPAFLHPAVWPVRLSNTINWPILVENNVLASQYPHCHDHANYKLLNAHYYQTVLNDTNQRDHTLTDSVSALSSKTWTNVLQSLDKRTCMSVCMLFIFWTWPKMNYCKVMR